MRRFPWTETQIRPKLSTFLNNTTCVPTTRKAAKIKRWQHLCINWKKSRLKRSATCSKGKSWETFMIGAKFSLETKRQSKKWSHLKGLSICNRLQRLANMSCSFYSWNSRLRSTKFLRNKPSLHQCSSLVSCRFSSKCQENLRVTKQWSSSGSKVFTFSTAWPTLN